MSNITSVKFENGSRREYTESVYQYDYGRVLQIEGLNTDKDLIEVHFAASNSGSDAVISIGAVQNGILTVQMPDSVMINEGTTLNYYITAYIYITDETSGTTQYEIQTPVIIRPKPGTTDTPQERDQFAELVEKVNSNLNQMKELNTSAEGSATAAEKSASKAENAASAAADSASAAKNSAGEANTAEEKAKSAATTAENAASAAADSASTAKNSAGEANTAKGVAKGYANEAANARNEAKSAATAANNAAVNAMNAAKSASSAMTTANNASKDANNKAKAAQTAASAAQESAETAKASAEAAEESRSATEELQKRYEQNENERIEAEKKREQETAEALAKVKEATDLIINQAGTIAFRINSEDGGLDAVILDKEGANK